MIHDNHEATIRVQKPCASLCACKIRHKEHDTACEHDNSLRACNTRNTNEACTYAKLRESRQVGHATQATGRTQRFHTRACNTKNMIHDNHEATTHAKFAHQPMHIHDTTHMGHAAFCTHAKSRGNGHAKPGRQAIQAGHLLADVRKGMRLLVPSWSCHMRVPHAHVCMVRAACTTC